MVVVYAITWKTRVKGENDVSTLFSLTYTNLVLQNLYLNSYSLDNTLNL